MPNDFHLSPQYKKKQSLNTRKNWENGSYSFKIKPLETRECKNPKCKKTFQIKPYDPKIFCSKKCAVIFNNTGRKMSLVTKNKISEKLSFLYKTHVLTNPNKGKKCPQFSHKGIKKVVNKALNEKIKYLYWVEKLNMRQVGEKLGLNMWAVRSRMRYGNIPRRTFSEANAITFSRKPLSYNKKTKLSIKEKLLHQAAVMLYWAEGAKDLLNVNFTNSNPKMIYLFLKALRTIYRVDEKRIRGHLYCYPNQDPKKLSEYWSNFLKLPQSQFIKPYIRPNFKEENKDKLPYGVFHIVYSDKKLIMQILNEIDIIQSTLAG